MDAYRDRVSMYWRRRNEACLGYFGKGKDGPCLMKSLCSSRRDEEVGKLLGENSCFLERLYNEV